MKRFLIRILLLLLAQTLVFPHPSLGQGAVIAGVASTRAIDAWALFNAGIASDICDAIDKSFQQLAGTQGYVDAGGFPSGGNYVCSAAHSNAVLSHCTSGEVQLGTYAVWLTFQTSNSTFGMGLPIFGVTTIPNNCGGWRGRGRGVISSCGGGTCTVTGTVIAVCTGTNTPITGCAAPVTTRHWMISTTTVGHCVNNTNRCYMAVNATGMNLIGGEPIRIEGSNTKNNDGAYRVCDLSTDPAAPGVYFDPNCPAVPTSTTIYVVIPSNSNTTTLGPLLTACSLSCGTIHGGLPLVEPSPVPVLTSSFGQSVRDLTIDCWGLSDCVPYRNLGGQEESGLFHVKLSNFVERAADVHTTSSQQTSWDTVEIIVGTQAGPSTSVGTTGLFIGENGIQAINGNLSIVMASSHVAVQACMIDTQRNEHRIQIGHGENCQVVVEYGVDAPTNGGHYNFGGTSSASCSSLGCLDTTTDCTTTCVADGPFAESATLNGALTGGTGLPVTVTVNALTSFVPVIGMTCDFDGGGVIGNRDQALITSVTSTTVFVVNLLANNHANASTLACGHSTVAYISDNFPLPSTPPFTSDFMSTALSGDTGTPTPYVDFMSGPSLYVPSYSTNPSVSLYAIEFNGTNFTRNTSDPTVPTVFAGPTGANATLTLAPGTENASSQQSGDLWYDSGQRVLAFHQGNPGANLSGSQTIYVDGYPKTCAMLAPQTFMITTTANTVLNALCTLNGSSLTAFGKTVHVYAVGYYSASPTASTLTFSVRYGTHVLISWTTPSDTANAMNMWWKIEAYLVVVNTSGGLTFEGQGDLSVQIGGNNTVTPTLVPAISTATVGAFSGSSPQNFSINQNFNTAGTTNVISMRQQNVRVGD